MNCILNRIKNERIKNECIKEISYKNERIKKLNYKKWTYQKRLYKNKHVKKWYLGQPHTKWVSGTPAYKSGIWDICMRKWYPEHPHIIKVVSRAPLYKSGIWNTCIQKWYLGHLQTKVISGAPAYKICLQNTCIQVLFGALTYKEWHPKTHCLKSHFSRLAVSKCSVIYHWHVCDRSQRKSVLN